MGQQTIANPEKGTFMGTHGRVSSREPVDGLGKMRVDLFFSILEGITKITTENLRGEDFLYKSEQTFQWSQLHTQKGRHYPE